MGILDEELVRMGKLASHPHFSLALIAISFLIGILTYFGQMLICFLGFFLELLGLAIGIWAAFSIGFFRTNKEGGSLSSAALGGSIAMLEANLPRQVIGFFGSWTGNSVYLLLFGIIVYPLVTWGPMESLHQMLLGFDSTYGLALLVSFSFVMSVLYLAFGFVLGFLGGVFGRNKVAKSLLDK